MLQIHGITASWVRLIPCQEPNYSKMKAMAVHYRLYSNSLQNPMNIVNGGVTVLYIHFMERIEENNRTPIGCQRFSEGTKWDYNIDDFRSI